jgi:succinate dehydrogenase/fumarate reductase flavoprotein subunit
LSQYLRASLQKGDGVAIAHGIDPAFVGPSTHCFLDFSNTGFPIFRTGTNSALYSRPVFFLLRCQLQRATVPGLMAAGEAACVSVHGANRLGCNSLVDIVVFGRAAAQRCAEKLTAKARQPELPPDAGEETLARFDKLRIAKGGTPTSTLRLQMQRAMQSYATVFRTASILQEGKKLYARSGTVCPTSPSQADR